MARYIDADKLMEAIEKNIEPYKSWDCTKADVVMDTILEQPTAEVVEVKHGKWLEHEEMFYDAEFESTYPEKCYKCSECGRVESWEEPYCHCGAKMDGGNAE